MLSTSSFIKSSLFCFFFTSFSLGLTLVSKVASPNGGIQPVSEAESSLLQSGASAKSTAAAQGGKLPNIVDLIKGMVDESSAVAQPEGEKHDLTGLLNKLHQEMTVLKSLTNMAHALGVTLPPLPFGMNAAAGEAENAVPEPLEMLSKLAMVNEMMGALKKHEENKAHAPADPVELLKSLHALATMAKSLHGQQTAATEEVNEIPDQGHPLIRLARLVAQLKDQLHAAQASSLIQNEPATTTAETDVKVDEKAKNAAPATNEKKSDEVKSEAVKTSDSQKSDDVSGKSNQTASLKAEESKLKPAAARVSDKAPATAAATPEKK